MIYKVGDRIRCKKFYKRNSNLDIFYYGCEYEVIKCIGENYFELKLNPRRNVIIDDEELHEYFYTKQEMRELKLKKLVKKCTKKQEY